MHTKISSLNRLGIRNARLLKAMTVTLAAVALPACSGDLDTAGHVAGWSLIDAQQRHPIIVSEQPADLSVRVARGSDGLTAHQRANVADFLGRYRGSDSGNGRLTINVPSGSPNEVAALKAVADLRDIIRDYGIDDSRVIVNAYHSDGGHQPPLRISYTRFVAEAPQCGHWSVNVADDPRNLPYPNLGCSTQRNFAMQVANPADLLGPRTMSPALAEKRDQKWEKYNKNEAVVSKKDQDERASVKSEN
ncbi:MAG: CpaD family pilus assembly protein [Hyphomicrobiaceae bacterium]|nr:CpaD family pilus assembly protein [Hyphomicrobiaceae bacterium]